MNIDNLVKEFDVLIKESTELQLVSQWLRANQVAIEADLPINLPDLTLNEITASVTEFQYRLNLPEETINLLQFFLTKRSLLFEAISNKYMKDLPYKVCSTQILFCPNNIQQITFDDIIQVVKNVQKFLEQLVCLKIIMIVVDISIAA